MSNHTIELQAYRVHIPSNIYTGKYYDYSSYGYIVDINDNIRTPQDAINWINDNKTEVLEKMDKIKFKYGNSIRRFFPKDIQNNVFFKKSYRVTGPIKVVRYVR